MRITDFSATKKGRIALFVDGEFYCSLHLDIFAATSLEVGTEVNALQLESLRERSEETVTRERAIRLLSARSYTVQGLYEKLLAYSDEDCASAAVTRMIELGLLDDEDYARRYASDCLKLKGWSRKKTKQSLLQKGIDRELAEETLAAFADEDDTGEEPAIAALVLKKYRSRLEDEQGVRKTIDALLRAGFRYDDIRRVLENLAEDLEYYAG